MFQDHIIMQERREGFMNHIRAQDAYSENTSTSSRRNRPSCSRFRYGLGCSIHLDTPLSTFTSLYSHSSRITDVICDEKVEV